MGGQQGIDQARPGMGPELGLVPLMGINAPKNWITSVSEGRFGTYPGF